MLKVSHFAALAMFCAVASVASLGYGQKGKSNALNVGAEAPAFAVAGADGNSHTLESLSQDSELVVVVFTCNRCPVAKAYEQRLIDFNEKYSSRGVKLVAINSNTRTESLDAVKEKSEEDNLEYVYAFDSDGSAAKSFGASVTPEVFVIEDGKIVYHGAFDDSKGKPSKHYLADSVDALLSDKTFEPVSTKAFGCGIKMK